MDLTSRWRNRCISVAAENGADAEESSAARFKSMRRRKMNCDGRRWQRCSYARARDAAIWASPSAGSKDKISTGAAASHFSRRQTEPRCERGLQGMILHCAGRPTEYPYNPSHQSDNVFNIGIELISTYMYEYIRAKNLVHTKGHSRSAIVRYRHSYERRPRDRSMLRSSLVAHANMPNETV